MADYDKIGANYATHRKEDPELRRQIREALADAKSVVNVGAGTGSYEPQDLNVIAVEPSEVMAAQRQNNRPAVRGIATNLPLHDNSVDAAMTILSLHHWYPDQQRGVQELCRVARDRVVIVTIDPSVSGTMWLMKDYLTEVQAIDNRIFPEPRSIANWLGPHTTIDTVPVSRDTPDHTLLSFWAHPERVLDPEARAATSGFSRQPSQVVDCAIRTLTADLESGVWEAAHGELRRQESLDCGLRIIHGKVS